VISECFACANLKEGIELIEAVEQTGKEYVLLDQTTYRNSYECFKTLISADNIVECKTENSYNTLKQRKYLIDNNSEHWRNHIASTIYTTHELGMAINYFKSRPISVHAREFGWCQE
jgi:predicted dehydrogenase